MHGSLKVTFLELFTDTVCTHGAQWAEKYYLKRGMQKWEFGFWLGQIRVEIKA